jgi:hypothetical protein
MMFPRRDLSVKQGLPRLRILLSGHALFFCCVIAFSPSAGIIEHAAFSGGLVPDSLIVADSIVVAVARPNVLSRAFGPAFPNRTAAVPQLPDVYAPADNKFRFFWFDPVQSKIFRRDIAVLSASVDTSADTVSVCLVNSNNVRYLHCAHSDNHYLVSFIKNTSNLTVCGPSGQPNTGNVGLSMQGATLCYIKDSTFLSVYIAGTATSNILSVLSKQINFNGPTFNIQSDSTLLAKDPTVLPPLQPWIDPSIGADSSGNLCALWMRGNNATNKKIKYGLFNSDFSTITLDSFPDSIAGSGLVNYYDNAPVVSYARKKFAAVSWDKNGILLSRFEIKSATQADTSTFRVTSGAYCRYPAVAANGRFFAVSWMNYSADKKNVRIRCVRYKIIAGSINVDSIATPEFSAADTTFTTGILDTSKIFLLRCAMDSTGNLAFCWNLNDCAHACVWASRNLLKKSGSWISPADSLPSRPIDSVSFTMGIVQMNPASIVPSSQDTLDSLYLSVDNGVTWNFFKNAAQPSQAVKGPYKYFNYKIKLKPLDSLVTPAVKKVSFLWNAKPRIGALDTVTINSAIRPGEHFGDTISCLSRSDTVRCRLGVISIDTLDTVYTGSVRKGLTISDSVNRNTRWWISDTVLPLTKSDTIAWRFTAHNKSGWAAQDSVVYVKTHNAVPRLSVQTVRNGGDTCRRNGRHKNQCAAERFH